MEQSVDWPIDRFRGGVRGGDNWRVWGRSTCDVAGAGIIDGRFAAGRGRARCRVINGLPRRGIKFNGRGGRRVAACFAGSMVNWSAISVDID